MTVRLTSLSSVTPPVVVADGALVAARTDAAGASAGASAGGGDRKSRSGAGADLVRPGATDAAAGAGATGDGAAAAAGRCDSASATCATSLLDGYSLLSSVSSRVAVRRSASSPKRW